MRERKNMARRDALLRLRKTLLARYTSLRHQLTVELSNLHDFRAADSPGDSVNGAFDTSGEAMSSQLAESAARELGQMERAVDCMKHEIYGICENCQKRICAGAVERFATYHALHHL
jgi:RNA polymerase-binding transcription factor DksA